MACKDCASTAQKMNNKTPQSWLPFGPGPSDEDPQHFYVYREEDWQMKEEVEQVGVIPLCEVKEPKARE